MSLRFVSMRSASLFALAWLGYAAPIVAAAADAPMKSSVADAVLGDWLTEDKDGIVRLYRCGEAVCGKLFWIKPSDKPGAALDDKNPDPKLRNRPLCGMEFMGGFAPQSDGSYSSGWIYSPRHGANFNATIAAGEDDTLDLRGYFLVPLLGETQTWTRVKDAQPCNIPSIQ